MISIILMFAGLIALPVAARWLVNGAMSIAGRYRMDLGLATLLFVAFGTSLPELAVNLIASTEQQGQIVVGNIFGSNIANILLILGITVLVRPVAVPLSEQKQVSAILTGDLALTLCACTMGILLPLVTKAPSGFARWNGIILLAMFIGLMSIRLWSRGKETTVLPPQKQDAANSRTLRPVCSILTGIAALSACGHIIVNGVLTTADFMHISSGFVAATVVAIGTSLPELATALALARNGKGSLTVTNISGSNMFNIGCILGISVVIHPFTIDAFAMRLILLTCLMVVALKGMVSLKTVITRPIGAFMIASYFTATLLMQKGMAG